MNDILKLMSARHSVRQYLDKLIPEELRRELDAYAAEQNEQSGLHMQVIYDDPDCFNSRMAHYGRFEGCGNYIAMVGAKAPDLEERSGFYGELLVLKAQELGLNTCWAALTHGKSRAVIKEGEKEVILIALGHGKTQGAKRKSKTYRQVSNITKESPEWFKNGVRAALLAPTAMNQQRFWLELEDGTVTASTGRLGICLKIDLGIVKCHFELGAGKENFCWG